MKGRHKLSHRSTLFLKFEMTSRKAREGGKSHAKYRKPMSFWSILTVSWLTPILKKAKNGPLDLDDVYKVSEAESAEYLSKESQSFRDKVAKYLASGRTLPKPDLKYYLYQFFGHQIALVWAFSLMDAAFAVSIPLFMHQLLLRVEDVDGVFRKESTYFYAIALSFSVVLQRLSFDLFTIQYDRIQNSLKVLLTDMIMTKQFKISPDSKSIYSNSDIMNLIQTEIGFASSFWVASPPATLVQIFLQCFFLFQLLGLPFLVAVGAIVLVTGCSMYISASLDYWMTGMRKTTNARVSIVREFVQGKRW